MTTTHPETVTIERKALFGAGTKVLNDEQGIVEAIVSVTGIVDEVKDIITPGAYAKTIMSRLPKGVYSHSWEQPVAKALDAKELLPGDPGLPKTTTTGEPWPAEAGAVMVKMQFNLDTQRGREAYSDVRFYGDEQEWSIGYQVPRGGSRMDHRKGIRHIDTIEWFEFSPVLFGAMPLAHTASVKGLRQGAVQQETKALQGSFEALQRALEDAIKVDLMPPSQDSGGGGMTMGDGWVTIKGTFPGRVVACWYHDGKESTYEYQYTWDGENVTLGDSTPVEVVETVQPLPADAESATEDMPTNEDEVDTKSVADLLIEAATPDVETKTAETDEPLTGRDLVENAILRRYL